MERSKLIDIGKKISKIPDDFKIHKTLSKIFDLRLKKFDDNGLILSTQNGYTIN